MSLDKREQILVRLEAILKNELGASFVHRNRSDLDSMQRPCAIMLDGVESSTGQLSRKSGRGPDIRVDLMELRPQIFLFLKRREERLAHERGPELSSYRMQFLKAVIHDAELISLVGSNGGIFYRGHDTDMQTGEAVQGMLLLHFAFQYVLDPNDLLD